MNKDELIQINEMTKLLLFLRIRKNGHPNIKIPLPSETIILDFTPGNTELTELYSIIEQYFGKDNTNI